MKKMIGLLFVFIAISTTSFALTLHSMNKAQVSKAFVNNTLVVTQAINLHWGMTQNTNNSKTVFLDNQGHLFGKMKYKPTNAPQSDKGTYIIKRNGTMLITWQHWDHGKTIHAHFFNTKNAYVAVDNMIGSAMVFYGAFEKDQIHSGNHL